MFVTGGQSAAPPPSQPGLSAGPRLIRAERRTFAGPAGFLDDPAERADIDTYLSDLTGAYPQFGPLTAAAGQSYGEMAEALIGAVTAAEQPVDLLVLAYAIHDMQPGRATATYLSHICPGVPLSFAICDQGSAAAFSGLRIARDYPGSAGPRRTLLIVVEQAMLPYASGAAQPAQHRGVAMLFENGTFENRPIESGQLENGPIGNGRQVNALPESAPAGGAALAENGPATRLVALRQRPNLAAEAVPGQAEADLAELSAGYREVRLVLTPSLADVWPAPAGLNEQARVGPVDQPSTSAWWQLLAELDEIEKLGGADRPDLLVVADYDPQLRYLCLAAIEPA